jgi:hypothetical protein
MSAPTVLNWAHRRAQPGVPDLRQLWRSAVRAVAVTCALFDLPRHDFFTKGEFLERPISLAQHAGPPTQKHHPESPEQRPSSLLEPVAWVAAAVVAKHLGVDVSYVYEHAGELGARRLGNGPKARLRFRLDLVDSALIPATRGANSAGKPLRANPRRRRATNRSTPLLPIRAPRTRS